MYNVDVEKYLYDVEKPAQYIGNEINSIIKDDFDRLFTIIYPDTYEIGMSHLGWQILYHIINNEFENISCQRAFMPQMDMLEVMKKNNLPMFTLEDKISISYSEAILFTLQYELNYTNILEMLDVSGIPIYSIDRKESDPIIFAGGTSISNPKVLAPFIDVFVFGDGETPVRTIAEIFNRIEDRTERLKELSKLPYTFVPFFDKDKNVKSHIEPLLEKKNYPNKRIVPNINVVHDRITVEIMRGCVRGCRFCSAGMLYRPFREKPLKNILQEIADGINSTGDDVVGLLSLSSSDYSQINRLLEYAYRLKKEKNIIISMPSTRIDNMPKVIGDELFKKNSITIAPEAGSQRLRDILNKNISEEEILNSVKYAFDNNWNVVKLYFMVGLPFETWEDIEAMAKLINTISDIAETYKGRRKKEIHVSIGPFTPRPFTPFQWEGFMGVEEILKRAQYVKLKTKRRFVKSTYRDPYTSLIETALIRGDERVSTLIHRMWKDGAVLQGWGEYFEKYKWVDELKNLGLLDSKAFSGFDIDDELPWDFITYGEKREYFESELKKAKKMQKTPDCKFSSCSSCGVCNKSIKNVESSISEDIDFEDIFGVNEEYDIGVKFFNRFEVTKVNEAKFLSFGDFRDKIKRALIACKINPHYSQGYSHLIDFSFSSPTPFGVSSMFEEIEFRTSYQLTNEHVAILNNFLTKNIQIVNFISQKGKIIPQIFKYDTVLYKTIFNREEDLNKFVNNISSIIYEKKSKKGKVKIVEFIKGVKAYFVKNNVLFIRIYNFGTKSVKLDSAITTLFGENWYNIAEIVKIKH